MVSEDVLSWVEKHKVEDTHYMEYKKKKKSKTYINKLTLKTLTQNSLLIRNHFNQMAK